MKLHRKYMKKIKQINEYDSSTVCKSIYEYSSGNLIVEFKSGASYIFYGVPRQTYDEFSTSDSIGKSFNQLIKPLNGEKITS
jgi:hypothetical protein